MASSATATADHPSAKKRSRLPVRRGGLTLLAVLVLAVAFATLIVAVCSGWMPQPAWLTGLGSSGGGSGSDEGDSQPIVKPAGLEALSYEPRGWVDFGEFAVCVFDPGTGNGLQATFRLKGRLVEDDQEAFWVFMSGHHRAFREQVAVAIRNCDVEDLLDPKFRMLRKKLVARINRGLGKRLLKSVQIKDYKLYESLGGTDLVERELPRPKPSTSPITVYDPDKPAETTAPNRKPER